ncbi:MAG: beta-lysine 5,6-aminomutase alpha subunit [Actinomycetota bacterium]|jgi:beta-lysine 5,6-aminomutase alpha subunit|nr:beta-lysine 5,6-aminomutase alpha subunit [Actinomycetota bacterium]
MAPRLDLDPGTVARARALARRAGEPVVELARTHTTISVERAVLRCAGVTGADVDGIPWVDRLADVVREQVGLEHGVALPVHDAVLRGEAADLTALAQKAAAGGVTFGLPVGAARDRAGVAARAAAARGLAVVDRRRAERERLVREIGDAPRRPWIYLIVATGNLHEDIPQARAAARAGADVVAVIRSTGQSLPDYVPEGATTSGYAGTYATRENFRLMRAALDEVSREFGRYVRLTHYASGLCMPEIATLAGRERLDMMLNDSMYGSLDEELFASYADVQFRAPVRVGDVVEVTATVTRSATRSRTLEFRAVVVCRGRGGSAAEVLARPIVAVSATGTVVVPGPAAAAGNRP